MGKVKAPIRKFAKIVKGSAQILAHATARPRARAHAGLAKIPTRKQEYRSKTFQIADFNELEAKKNCHLEAFRDGRGTK